MSKEEGGEETRRWGDEIEKFLTPNSRTDVALRRSLQLLALLQTSTL